MDNKLMCIHCIYFNPSNVFRGFGECRYNPPVVDLTPQFVVDGRDPLTSVFPFINAGAWCGKFLDKNIKYKLEGAQ